jgi:hypothetical protein
MCAVVTPGYPYGIAVDYPYAFIADGASGLTVFDVTDPWTLLQVGTETSVSDVKHVAVNGNYVCTLPEGAGFDIFDVTTPSAPVSVFLPQLLNYPMFPAFYGNYMIANDNHESYTCLKILDVENPEDAHIVSEYYPVNAEASYMDVSADGYCGIVGETDWELLDVSDPLSITSLANGSESSACSAIKINGDAMYVLHTTSIETYDIDPLPPTHTDTLNIPNNGTWMAIKGDYMYLSADMMFVVSLANPYYPSLVDYILPGSQAMVLKTSGDYLYAAEFDRLEIYDISQPESPAFTGSVVLTMPPNMSGIVAVGGQYSYVSGTIPTTVCQTWPPDNPFVVTELDHLPYRYAYYLNVTDNYLWECGMPFGLQLYKLY